MSIITVDEQSKDSTEASKYERTTRQNLQGEKLRQRITSRLLSKVSSSAQSRNEKILNVRHQLEAGTYEIQMHLDVATDRLIENLIIKELEEDEVYNTKQSL